MEAMVTVDYECMVPHLQDWSDNTLMILPFFALIETRCNTASLGGHTGENGMKIPLKAALPKNRPALYRAAGLAQFVQIATIASKMHALTMTRFRKWLTPIASNVKPREGR